jgi:hypothetical protein
MKTTTIRAAFAAAAMCAAALPSFAATAPDFVTSEAVFWFDASTLSQIPGEEVASWPDVRGEGFLVASTAPNRNNPMVASIASGSLAGKKVVDFGNLGSDRDMKFDAAMVKSVCLVMEIDNAKYASLLGGAWINNNYSDQRFCREKQAAFAANSGQTGSYSIWTNGVQVADPLNTATPSGYNVISYRYDDTSKFPSVGYLASDRNINGRVGGKRLCEVIAFSRVLTDEERVAVEYYLHAKWFEEEAEDWGKGVSLDRILNMAQVRFDASVASSFHYDAEDPTKVVQWDDLSGNGNNFTPGRAVVSNTSVANYGTVGEVASRPVFDSGAASSGIDLTLNTRLANTRTTFMVAEVQRNGNVFWLGDDSATGKYPFHRGSGGQYAYAVNASSEVKIDSKNGGEIWCNSVKVSSPTGDYPENPGALSVYTFRTAQDCGWKNLGQDRGINNRNGGKKVAELITFSFALPDKVRERIEDYLIEKWAPTEAYIDEMAAVHVDASSADNFNYTGANITGWKNAGFDADLVSSSSAYGAYGYTNGVPSFLMGTVNNGIDMKFTRHTDIRAVFWAMDIQRNGNAFFLGDASAYDYHRGVSSTLGSTPDAYFHTHGGAVAKNGNMFCDGVKVASVTADKPPYGMHVFDFVAVNSSSAEFNTVASCLARDRNISGRNGGGRAISELIVFTNNVWGLTRVGVRRRLENKWTRRCGWAGAGDAEWGAGKYRVFGADATVPAEGAAADGVGFTASATLSGGTLTLGDGGVFASEGADATISAPVTGKIGAYGPGKVTLANALGTVDSVSVGYGSTLVLSSGGTVTGALSIQANGRIVLDVSELAERAHTSITFANLVLPAGGTLYDYVSLEGWEERGHFLTVTANTIHVNSPDVAVAAAWTAAQDTNLENPANWSCLNLNGEPVANVIPEVCTTSATFNADCDLRALGRVAFAEGSIFDLNGHSVRISGFADQGYPFSKVTNSDANETAELHIDVASGKTVTNATVAISGQINLVKDGAGTFVAAKRDQTYVGVNEVAAGVMEVLNNFRDSRFHVFGAKGNSFLVRTDATFKMNGMYAQANAEYRFVLDGGRLLGSYEDVPDTYGQIHLIELTKDSTFEPSTNCGLVPGGTFGSTTLDLGGHKLAVPIGNGRIFFLYNTTVKNGMVDVTSGGWLQTKSGCTVTATNVDFRVRSALRLDGPISVRGYEPEYSDSNYNEGTAAFNVHGTFKPAAGHNCFYGVTMQDGSTIDLSNPSRALPLPRVSAFKKGDNTLKFASGTIRVKLGERKVTSKTCLISWSSKPDGIDAVRFVNADGERPRRFTARPDGLYSSGGLVLIVR